MDFSARGFLPGRAGAFLGILTGVEVIIVTPLRHQFFMAAALDNLAAADHQNHVGAADGAQPVRHHKGGL